MSFRTLALIWLYFFLFLHLFYVIALVQHFVNLLTCLHLRLLVLVVQVGPLNINSNIPISSMSVLSFCPFPFSFAIPVVVLAMGSPNNVSVLPILAFVASVPFLHDFLIWISFVAFFILGFTFTGPLLPLFYGIFA